MLRVLIQNWWLLALRGLFALVFAALAFSLRALLKTHLINAIAFVTLVVVCGLLVFAAGICTIAAGVRGAGELEKSWLLVVDGLVLSIAGLLVMMVPKLTVSTLGHIVACSAVVIGICELFLAQTLRRHIPDEWFLVLSGIASMCFAGYLVLMWKQEAYVIGRWLGIYAGFIGMVTLGLAFRLRALRTSIHKLGATAAR
jgi:uncharacterized membrane protein HdeD (DUF308 family)